MSAPRVSVCLDLYNYAAYLPEAVESVLQQTFTDFELIISDDCSTDGSFEIAREYAARDPRVRVRRNARNLGMIGNRNACLAAAAGEYVKPLHADDFLCADDALARLVEAMDCHPQASLAASALCGAGPDRTLVGERARFPDRELFAGTAVITRCLAEQRNLVGPPSAVLFRRRHASRGFNETFFHAADLEMWFHLLEQGCFICLAEPLCAYRRHPAQQTRKDLATMAPGREYPALLERYLEKPYVHLRRLMKRYLVHDALARLDCRSRRLGVPEEGTAAVRAYGALRYGLERPLFAAARRGIRVTRSLARRADAAPQCEPREARPAGVNVAGFIRGEYGIGESSRAFGEAVRDTGLPCAFINLEGNRHRHEDGTFSRFSRGNPYSTNLMTFSFDYARRFYRDMGRRFFRGRRNIALWYWELEEFPAAFHTNFAYYDEIWTASEFCRNALAAVSPVPVHHIPYPFYGPGDCAPDRERFGFGAGEYVFLFVFDYCSEIARKNPLGVLRAFRRAFRADDRALLALKSINAHRRPEDAAAVRREAEGLNARLIEEHLDAAAMRSLYASCDAYVSLHRSEGLGLGMAQAMFLGKPVIATGYSGNLEFMTEENSLLVRWKRSEIDRDYGPYPRGGSWAEPDVEHAAARMRELFEDPGLGSEIGRRAALHVRRVLDPEKSVKEIRERIGADPLPG